jgi:predicted nucleic acid-binding protein
VTLCDTGPLVALLDARDQHHKRCHEAVESLPAEPLLTTLACLTEAMHLLAKSVRRRGVTELLGWWQNGFLLLHDLDDLQCARVRALLHKYGDLPMDLADATLVAAAASLGLRQVFTVDKQFHIYRLPDGSAFDVIP